jgi:hypothetical protein
MGTPTLSSSREVEPLWAAESHIGRCAGMNGLRLDVPAANEGVNLAVRCRSITVGVATGCWPEHPQPAAAPCLLRAKEPIPPPDTRNSFSARVPVQRHGQVTRPAQSMSTLSSIYIQQPSMLTPHVVLSPLHVHPNARQECRGPRRWRRGCRRRTISLQEAGSRPVQPHPRRHASPLYLAPSWCPDGRHP